MMIEGYEKGDENGPTQILEIHDNLEKGADKGFYIRRIGIEYFNTDQDHLTQSSSLIVVTIFSQLTRDQ